MISMRKNKFKLEFLFLLTSTTTSKVVDEMTYYLLSWQIDWITNPQVD